MTRKEFIHLLVKMDSSVAQTPPTAPLQSVAFLVAADWWIKQKPENAYSASLRAELKFLVEHGRFSFDSEQPAKQADSSDGKQG